MGINFQILKRGAHIDDRDGLTDMTLLHYVSKAGAQGLGDVDECCRMVNLLVSKGCDVFAKCRWTNMSALHYATFFDVSPVVEALLKNSKARGGVLFCLSTCDDFFFAADVDTRCAEFDHGTPLHIAASNLAYDSAQVLLQHGANPLIRDGLNRTPLGGKAGFMLNLA
jgi:CAP-Gly domain-containing linker protein 3/4